MYVNVCKCMHMYVCMYVCMYACMHACMYVCMYVCTYVRMHACMHTCIYVCLYAWMYVITDVCMHVCMLLSRSIQASMSSCDRHAASGISRLRRILCSAAACADETRLSSRENPSNPNSPSDQRRRHGSSYIVGLWLIVRALKQPSCESIMHHPECKHRFPVVRRAQTANSASSKSAPLCGTMVGLRLPAHHCSGSEVIPSGRLIAVFSDPAPTRICACLRFVL